MSRRLFLKSALAASATLSLGTASAASSSKESLTGFEDSISRKLYAGDGLARPIPSRPTKSDLAQGKDRALVLGGGGEYYLAWYCGFFHGLLEQGFDPNLAEMVVGTSAGSYIGSSLTSGHFGSLRAKFEFFGHFPGLFARLAPVAQPNVSQRRAIEINASVRDGTEEGVRAIGRAALAADNKVNGSAVERLAWLMTEDSRTDWPTPTMYTTANDCYTGERIIVGQAVARRNGIPLAHAAAASSSLPGMIGPTLLGQRYCMDGGICRTLSHCDVVAGARRALVIALTDGVSGTLLTGITRNLHKEVDDLKAAGTKVYLVIAGTPPGVDLLDPKQIAPALRTGYERSRAEGEAIRRFWA